MNYLLFDRSGIEDGEVEFHYNSSSKMDIEEEEERPAQEIRTRRLKNVESRSDSIKV